MAMTRRDFLRWTARAGATALVGAALAGGYAYQIEPSWIEVVEQTLVLPRLPDAFAGFTIAQISDLHFGSTPSQLIEAAVRMVNDLQPSAIVITGDFFTRWSGSNGESAVAILSKLRATLGVYGVLGNHDWWENGPMIQGIFRQMDARLLTNELVAWEREGQRLYLAGVDDVWVGQHDLQFALRQAPANAPIILLAHEPDFADQAASDGRAMLQLSGHSHGGQICWPWTTGIPIHLPPLARKYPRGLYQIGDMKLYTNRGIGTVSAPMRFWCRPEITLFTLNPRG